MPDVDAVNSGYARVLLEEYLENPEAVPSEWRALFESGDGDLIEALPGLARLLETLRETNGHATPKPAPST
jgi:2-oxoglutarate dehydrogenase complex dehydrogenase (E1) component-like enzyme